MPIAKEYQRFLLEQTHLKDSTRKVMRYTLSRLPSPDKLNARWFKERMRKVSPVTLRGELMLAKQVFRFLELDTSDLERIKITNMRETVTVEDLYTQEELDAIFGACLETRDRAMLHVLYESAVRAGELLSMTFETLEFQEDDIATVIVKGKTGTRHVYVRDSLPALRAWLNVHPTKKGEIWLNLKEPHNPLTYTGLYQTALKIIRRAGLKRDKRKILHMFRHTRITELVKLGVRGQSLSKLVGWTKGSNMEAVYVHLSTADVENEVRTKAFGLEVDEARTTTLLKSTICPRCETTNDPQTWFCSKCNMPLSDDAIVKAIQQQERKREEILEEQGKVAELEERVTYLETQLKVRQASLSMKIENNKEELLRLEEFLRRLEKD